MPAIAGVMQQMQLVGQKLAELRRVVVSELLAVTDRQLERRTFQVTQQDLEVIGIDMGFLWRRSEEIIWMLDNVLINWRARSDHDCDGRRLTPSRASRPL